MTDIKNIDDEMESAVALSLLFGNINSPMCIDIITAIAADMIPHVKFTGKREKQ